MDIALASSTASSSFLKKKGTIYVRPLLGYMRQARENILDGRRTHGCGWMGTSKMDRR
jgi:hypothetical protein